MSMEAQFYEAQRRQNSIKRRQSLQAQKEFDQQSEYQYLCIPLRIIRQGDKNGRCTCIPTRRINLITYDKSLFQRDRDIYPRPLLITTNIRRHIQRAKLPNRFSSIDYLQQW